MAAAFWYCFLPTTLRWEAHYFLGDFTISKKKILLHWVPSWLSRKSTKEVNQTSLVKAEKGCIKMYSFSLPLVVFNEFLNNDSVAASFKIDSSSCIVLVGTIRSITNKGKIVTRGAITYVSRNIITQTVTRQI
jgi:hypothetical protein